MIPKTFQGLEKHIGVGEKGLGLRVYTVLVEDLSLVLRNLVAN